MKVNSPLKRPLFAWIATVSVVVSNCVIADTLQSLPSKAFVVKKVATNVKIAKPVVTLKQVKTAQFKEQPKILLPPKKSIFAVLTDSTGA